MYMEIVQQQKQFQKNMCINLSLCGMCVVVFLVSNKRPPLTAPPPAPPRQYVLDGEGKGKEECIIEFARNAILTGFLSMKAERKERKRIFCGRKDGRARRENFLQHKLDVDCSGVCID